MLLISWMDRTHWSHICLPAAWMKMLYSLVLAGRTAHMEVKFAFSCLNENVSYCHGLAELAPGSEVIFAFSCPDKCVAYSLVLAGRSPGLEVICAFSYPG
jgi:hypothetical protein